MTEQVLLTPPYSRNPYLGLIQQALTKTGLRVACEPLRLSWRMPPVIHVHWEVVCLVAMAPMRIHCIGLTTGTSVVHDNRVVRNTPNVTSRM